MNNKMQKTGGDPVDMEKITTYLEAMNLASKLTKSEVQQFIEISQAFGLNPFKREIYANKYGDKMSIIVGFETYIKRAERSGNLSGWNVDTKGMVNHSDIGKSDITATITIHRKDWEHPFIHSVHFSEYFQNTMIWKTKPITMIKKVAMAQGFRLCFSDELGGMPYTSDELPTETINADHVVIPNGEVTVSMPEKKGPGRPKKSPILTPPEFPKPSIEEQIEQATSIPQLLQIFKDCPECQQNQDLRDALTKRKHEIMANIIQSKTSVDDLWELSKSEKDPHLLKLIQKRMEDLENEPQTENTQANDELF